MSEERPRPQFGEYATPEDQVKAMGVTDASLRIHPDEPPVQLPTRASASRHQPAAAVPLPRSRRWDVAATVGLLAYGLLTVVVGSARYADLDGLISSVYRTQGVGEFTSAGLAAIIGTAINVMNVVLYLIVFVASMTRLRTKRLAFHVPLIGGVVSAVVTVVLLAVVIVADPAFQAYARSA